MAWPNYQQLSLRSVSLRELSANIRLLNTMKMAALILLLIAVYLVGTHISLLPFLNGNKLHTSIAQSTVLTVIDQLFTGGSLDVLSPFALGIFPLFLFSSWTTTSAGGQTNSRGRLNILSSAVFIIGLFLIILWLCLSDIVPATFVDVGITFLYLTAGSGFLFIINNYLTKYRGPTIIAINAIVIAYTYARTLFFSKQSSELGVLALILLFVGSFVFLIKYTKYIPLVNIRGETVREGQLPIPATNSSMRFILLITTFIILAAITTLLNFFLDHTLSPFGDSLLDVLLFIAILIIISMALVSSEMIDSVISQFNGIATSRTLMTNYWLVSKPPTPVGEATARLLSHEALKCHRLNYTFYFIWSVVFSLVGLFAQLLHLPLNPLPFGPLGFLIVLTLCSELGYTLILAIYHFIQSVRFGDLWVPSTSALSNLQMLTESYDLDEIIDQFLPFATSEEKARLNLILLSLRKGQVRFADIKEILLIVNQIRSRMVGDNTDVMIFHFIIRFFFCVALSLIMTVFAVWLVQISLESTAFNDLGNKITVVLGLPATFLAFVPLVHLDESIKEIFLALKTNPRRLFQGMSIRSSHSSLTTYQRAELAYQVLLRQQRDIIDECRRSVLSGENIHMNVVNMIHTVIDREVDSAFSNAPITHEQIDRLIDQLDKWYLLAATLPVEIEGLSDREAIRKILLKLSVSFYEDRGKLFDEGVNILKEQFNIKNVYCWIYNNYYFYSTDDAQVSGQIVKLSSPSAGQLKDVLFYNGEGLNVTLAPLHTMERDLYLYFLGFFWSRHADRLNAAWGRLRSILGIQKEDLDQFEQQADDDFERLLLDIQLNTIYALLDVLQFGLLYFFPRFKKQHELASIVDTSISQNPANIQQSLPAVDTPEIPDPPPINDTAQK